MLEIKKQTQQPTCSSDLYKGTEKVREQNIKAQEKKRYDKNHPLPTPCSSDLNKRTENVREQNIKVQEKNYMIIPTTCLPTQTLI